MPTQLDVCGSLLRVSHQKCNDIRGRNPGSSDHFQIPCVSNHVMAVMTDNAWITWMLKYARFEQHTYMCFFFSADMYPLTLSKNSPHSHFTPLTQTQHLFSAYLQQYLGSTDWQSTVWPHSSLQNHEARAPGAAQLLGSGYKGRVHWLCNRYNSDLHSHANTPHLALSCKTFCFHSLWTWRIFVFDIFRDHLHLTWVASGLIETERFLPHTGAQSSAVCGVTHVLFLW